MNTDLSVPVFNVLKYFFIVIFVETISRRALHNIYVFLRRFDLYRGNASPLSSSRVDRYNLLAGKRSVTRFGFWFFLVVCFYTVEILFEFSSHAVTRVRTTAERLQVYNASFPTCGAVDVLREFVAPRLTEMALTCVDLTDEEYTVYKPLWIKSENRVAVSARCVKIPDNILSRGGRIYKDRRYSEGSPSWNAVGDLIKAVKASAWNTAGEPDTAFLVLSISNQNILGTLNMAEGGSTIKTGLFSIHISQTFRVCAGSIVGKLGEGVMQVALYSCIERKNNRVFNYLQVSGTAPVFLDASVMDTEPWTVQVVARFGIAIQNFTAGVLSSEEELGFTKPIGLGGMLSLAAGKDSDSINKYAAVYKHCDQIRVAQSMDSVSWQNVKHARTEEMITVSVLEWGLALVICWSLLLWMTSASVLVFADRHGMPKSVDGEVHIALRWAKHEDTELSVQQGHAEETQGASSRPKVGKSFAFPVRNVFLNVVVGKDHDDVVACQLPANSSRDQSKPFKRV